MSAVNNDSLLKLRSCAKKPATAARSTREMFSRYLLIRGERSRILHQIKLLRNTVKSSKIPRVLHERNDHPKKKKCTPGSTTIGRSSALTAKNQSRRVSMPELTSHSLILHAQRDNWCSYKILTLHSLSSSLIHELSYSLFIYSRTARPLVKSLIGEIIINIYDANTVSISSHITLNNSSFTNTRQINFNSRAEWYARPVSY